MNESERSKEVAKWNCPILWNCDERVDAFMQEGVADELIVVCSVEECVFAEIYIRSPKPREMTCKVIGSTCVNGKQTNTRLYSKPL